MRCSAKHNADHLHFALEGLRLNPLCSVANPTTRIGTVSHIIALIFSIPSPTLSSLFLPSQLTQLHGTTPLVHVNPQYGCTSNGAPERGHATFV